MKIIIFSLLALIYTTSLAQDKYLELVRSDLKTQKVALITEAMDFTDDQAGIFWPIYREYDFELTKLGDRKINLIKDYAANFENMTDEKAKELIETAFDIDSDLLELKKKYFKVFSTALSPTTAARYMQVENQIQLLLNLKIASELPLIGDTLEEQDKEEEQGTGIKMQN